MSKLLIKEWLNGKSEELQYIKLIDDILQRGTLEEGRNGSTKVFGKDTVEHFRYTRSKIGIAAQEFSVDWFFPIEKLLYYQAGYYGIKRNEATPMIDDLLERLGLAKKRGSRLRQLSGGMKRRFQIAKALVHDPDIIILDEPTIIMLGS